jgi:hypothetical protein
LGSAIGEAEGAGRLEERILCLRKQQSVLKDNLGIFIGGVWDVLATEEASLDS